jgi:hypothetical protein
LFKRSVASVNDAVNSLWEAVEWMNRNHSYCLAHTHVYVYIYIYIHFSTTPTVPFFRDYHYRSPTFAFPW